MLCLYFFYFSQNSWTKFFMVCHESWDQVLEVRYLPEASHDMSCTHSRHFVVLFVGSYWFYFVPKSLLMSLNLTPWTFWLKVCFSVISSFRLYDIIRDHIFSTSRNRIPSKYGMISIDYRHFHCLILCLRAWR